MSEFQYITKVTFYPLLNPKKADASRRGKLAEFTLLGAPNQQMHEIVLQEAIKLLQLISSFLGRSYKAYTTGTSGEHNGCWIDVTQDQRSLMVTHKYWSEEQITAFKSIVYALAQLHDWEVDQCLHGDTTKRHNPDYKWTLSLRNQKDEELFWEFTFAELPAIITYAKKYFCKTINGGRVTHARIFGDPERAPMKYRDQFSCTDKLTQMSLLIHGPTTY
ncbi:MAG: hypothetical protein U1A25_01090 [Candidatus Sungbacteria bacterium]|nr:hypothetical protein [bacterium]MDZ4260234.1 hypothetical protein [Candidatus Sungbacteria bacterium]